MPREKEIEDPQKEIGRLRTSLAEWLESVAPVFDHLQRSLESKDDERSDEELEAMIGGQEPPPVDFWRRVCLESVREELENALAELERAETCTDRTIYVEWLRDRTDQARESPKKASVWLEDLLRLHIEALGEDPEELRRPGASRESSSREDVHRAVGTAAQSGPRGERRAKEMCR